MWGLLTLRSGIGVPVMMSFGVKVSGKAAVVRCILDGSDLTLGFRYGSVVVGAGDSVPSAALFL